MITSLSGVGVRHAVDESPLVLFPATSFIQVGIVACSDVSAAVACSDVSAAVALSLNHSTLRHVCDCGESELSALAS